jgi:hypothetical protein
MRVSFLSLVGAIGLPALLLAGCQQENAPRPVVAQATAPDTLVAAAIPQIPERLRPAIQTDYDASPRVAYTLAVGAAGQGWSSHSGRGTWSQAERVRVAQQRCEHFAQGPCILVMVDGRLTGRTTAEPRALNYVQSFDASAVPFLNDAARADLVRYGSANRDRALVITRNGDYQWRIGHASEAEAQRDALQRCQQGGDGNRPCFVYAVNDRVVFTPQTDISDAIRPRR